LRTTQGWTTCWACGKRGYQTRRSAKRIKEIMHDDRLSVYRCLDGGSNYHIGHLDKQIIAGQVDRFTYYYPEISMNDIDRGV